MSSIAVLAYTAYLGGATAAQVIAAMQSVPPPASTLNKLGIRTITNIAAGAGPVVYTVTLGLGPTAPASGTPTLADAGASGSGIASVAVSAAGSGYVAPPVVSFIGGRTILAPNPGFPSQQPVESMMTGDENTPAAAQAYLRVLAVSFTGGSGYSANPIAIVSGRTRQGGSQATLALTVAGGIITGVTIGDSGDGYTEVPTVVVVDPTGFGATITITDMGVGEIIVTRQGGGYSSPPTVVLTPFFQATFPPTGDQSAMFKNLMNTALEQAVIGPVSASAPVII
jgi:hypothetical protein